MGFRHHVHHNIRLLDDYYPRLQNKTFVQSCCPLIGLSQAVTRNSKNVCRLFFCCWLIDCRVEISPVELIEKYLWSTERGSRAYFTKLLFPRSASSA